MTQSADFAARLLLDKTHMERNEVCTFEGIHVDLWWSKAEAARKNDFNARDAGVVATEPLTILAVDAPNMTNSKTKKYDTGLLLWLAHLRGCEEAEGA